MAPHLSPPIPSAGGEMVRVLCIVRRLEGAWCVSLGASPVSLGCPFILADPAPLDAYTGASVVPAAGTHRVRTGDCL